MTFPNLTVSHSTRSTETVSIRGVRSTTESDLPQSDSVLTSQSLMINSPPSTSQPSPSSGTEAPLDQSLDVQPYDGRPERGTRRGKATRLSGTVSDVHSRLRSLPSDFKDVVLVVGGNDCCKEDVVPAAIASDYTDLIKTASRKARHVTVSSVLPRNINNATVEANIVDLNDRLIHECKLRGITVVDHTFLWNC